MSGSFSIRPNCISAKYRNSKWKSVKVSYGSRFMCLQNNAQQMLDFIHFNGRFGRLCYTFVGCLANPWSTWFRNIQKRNINFRLSSEHWLIKIINIPRSRLIKPRRSHCERACKSKTSSNRLSADVNAGYSDECWWKLIKRYFKICTKNIQKYQLDFQFYLKMYGCDIQESALLIRTPAEQYLCHS